MYQDIAFRGSKSIIDVDFCELFETNKLELIELFLMCKVALSVYLSAV
jgi:hypothetical protein